MTSNTRVAGRALCASLPAVILGLTTACAQRPEDVSRDGDALQFVASAQGQVYYWAGCDNWESIPPANRRWFATSTDAEDAGYSPSTARGCEAPDVRAGLTPIDSGSCTVQRVVDGDTVVCAEAAERIRLLLVDAPEAGQGDAGEVARTALERILPPGTVARVELDAQERDQYGRILAYVYSPAGELVNEQLAREGYVTSLVIPPNVKYDERIRSAVGAARQERRGLWAGSAFDCSPADYRAQRCGP